MKILLAGGTGLLGTALTQSLQADGHTVYILSRHGKANTIKWDARTPTGWGHLVNEMDIVIHLAGKSTSTWPWTASMKKEMEDSRILPGLALVQAIREAHHRPSLFVQVSGINHYGTHGAPADESTPPANDFLAELTVHWEKATQPVEELGVRHLILRTSVVLARESIITKLISLPVKLFVGGPIGRGTQAFPWIHIKDWVGATRHLMDDKNAHGAYNLIAPEQATLGEFTKKLAKVLNRPYWFPVPAFLMRTILGEMSILILEGRFAQPRRLIEAGYLFQFKTTEAALHDLFS